MDRNDGFLAFIERVGNRLPDPASLFLIGLAIVMLVSQLAVWSGLSVTRPGEAGGLVQPLSLLTSDGLWWLISNLVKNFVNFPPLGVVLVGMFGIGLAERSGLLAAALLALGSRLSGQWLAPALIFLGVMSSIALDAGYVVLPPLAAALYLSAGRPPLAGVAAVFAGVSGGFSANLFITGLDPVLAGFSQTGASLIEPGYRVAVTANWWFMIASTFLLVALGWWVSARIVEPRVALGFKAGPPVLIQPMTAAEARALRWSGWTFSVLLAVAVAATLIPGWSLHGEGEHFPRWVEATVPLLLLLFILPAMVYGKLSGSIKSDKDAASMLGETMAAMGPYIVLAFFAAQFIEAFKYSHLGEMLAIAGGQFLSEMDLGTILLMLAFIVLTGGIDLFIGSMSAKYALMAPVFVPMFMLAGISPELTQVAYRIGDSVANIITPLNPYLIIILALIKRYVPEAGLGTLIAMMLPYTIVFALGWSALLVIWIVLGWPLGPEGGLIYPRP